MVLKSLKQLKMVILKYLRLLVSKIELKQMMMVRIRNQRVVSNQRRTRSVEYSYLKLHYYKHNR